MLVLLGALLLGMVAGLRTFTAPAILWILRHGGPAAYGLGVLALLEYAGDLSPKAPARTSPLGLGARLVSGAFCGWMLAAGGGAPPILGAFLGACGAVIGAYFGLAARLRAIALIGRVPSAMVEDAVAIVGAGFIVSYL
jgi:uncharacterized membrane protein